MLVLATLSACTAGDQTARHALNSSTVATSAFVLPPPGGPAVVSVIERRFANAVQQDVVLAADTAAPGQNRLRIQAFGRAGGTGTTRLPDPRLSDAGIGSELRTNFPGIAMRRSPLYAQNAYGPFGYAIGRHGSGDLCLYGWQRMTGEKEAGPLSPRGSIQVRMRVCQRGATEASLVALMYGYTITASLPGVAWNPYGAAPEPDPRLGRTGQAVYPQGASWVESVAEPIEDGPARQVRRAAAPRPSAIRRDIPAPPAGAPLVPAPPGSPAATPQVPSPPGSAGPMPVVPPPPVRIDDRNSSR